MNILITGASRGIGHELVKQFNKNPGNTIFIASRNAEQIKKLADDCKLIQPYSHVIPLAGDLTDPQYLDTLIAKLSELSESLDVLINNAGFLINKPFNEIQPVEIEQIFKVNAIAPVVLVQKCLPLLMKSGSAHIVNISSMGGFQGSAKFKGLAAYSASKAALASFTECLAEELNETKIKVNCLALGAVNTEMLAEAFPGYNALIKAAEMAEYICDFAMNGHKYFNGKIIPVSLSTP